VLLPPRRPEQRHGERPRFAPEHGRHDRRALARLLTLVARNQHLDAIRRGLEPLSIKPSSRVVAITGSAGVGKSTLIGKLIEAYRAQGQSVAVLACDPESPLTGGAVLGDRFRMPSRPDDAGVYVRSVAATSGQGAIAEHLDLMIRLLQAFGFDVVLVETVGAGQGDTAVSAMVDGVVLLVQPEAGDDIQWEKAGLLEIADLVVLHKADLPGADRVEAQLKSMLSLAGEHDVPVLRVSSAKGTGVDELRGQVSALPQRRGTMQRNWQRFVRLMQERLGEELVQDQAHWRTLLERWQSGEVADQQIVDQAWAEMRRG
jgi:LAO/AO transport system ATPase